MRCCKHTRILHVRFEVPKLTKGDTGDINNVGRIRNRYFRTRPFQSRAKRKHKIEEVVIERKKREQLRSGGKISVVR